MSSPALALKKLLETRPEKDDLQTENMYLKQVIFETAEFIIYYLGSQEDFDGDPEDYGNLLFDVSDLPKAA
jgi:hypothetical protein